jgi:8-oxo-dGTP pyrophosphatase MutT (NUDIX family)
MYKIFINDKPFFITNSKLNIDDNLETIFFNKTLFDSLLQSTKSNDFKGIILICDDVEMVFKLFASNYKIIEAAGGLVFNSSNDLLLIERLGVWDLPKGKIDLDETPEIAALREVEEECAVNELSIEYLVCKSYHTYFFKDKYIIKRTFWYKMNTTFSGLLVPQFEENITKVEWQPFTKERIDNLNTYESIRDVLKNYFIHEINTFPIKLNF